MKKEQRRALALRAHINSLLSLGAQIVERDPLTICYEGEVSYHAWGMLIAEEIETGISCLSAATDRATD